VKAAYTYIADGTKAGAVDSAGKGFDYLGTFVYANENNVRTLESTNFGGGRINKTNNAYDINYFITDHLGSTRVIVNSNGEIIEQKNYYPFGKEHENPDLITSTNRWGFSGKEKQTIKDLGWLDFMARMYANSEIPMWTTQDPLSEKYYSISTYSYAANNPLKYIDIDGRELKIWYKDTNGKSQSFVYRGQNVQHSNSFVSAVITAYKYNKSNGERAKNGGGASTVTAVESTDISIHVKEAEYGSHYEQFNAGGTLFWNPNLGNATDEGIVMSPATILDHEADHAIDAKTNPSQNEANSQYGTDNQYDSKEERRVITGSEQKTARANGEIKQGQVTRKNHGGKYVVTTSVTSTKVNNQKTKEYEEKERNRPTWTSEW
jgi:RHS repeat-associated protein